MRRAAPVLLALAVAIFLVPSALRPEELPFHRDILDFFLPMKAAYARGIQGGGLPWWDPWTFGGQPFFATLQSQVLYPPNVIFLVTPLGWGYSLTIAFHLAWAGLGAWALARALGASPAAAALALLGFEAGGFLVSLADLTNQLCAHAWMPWTLLAACRYAREPRSAPLAAWAACCALSFLGGEPQYAFLGGVASVALAWACARDARTQRALRRVALGAVAAAVMAVAATSVQLVPLAELTLRSERAEGVPMDAEGRHALEPKRLRAVVTPPSSAYGGPAGSYIESIHVGWLVLLLAGLGAFRKGAAPRVLVAGTAVSLALALGSHLPWLGPIQVEVFGALRYPIKNACVAALFVPVLAALGAESVASWIRPRAPRLLTVSLVALLTAVGFSVVAAQHGLVPTLPQAALLAPSEALAYLRKSAHPDGPRVHVSPLSEERLRARASRILRGDLAGAMRERVELLEGALPMLFEIPATGGASALAPRDAVRRLAAAAGPLSSAQMAELRAGWLLDPASRELPLPRVPVEGGAARLYRLDGFEPVAPARTWNGPNIAVAPPGLPPPSDWPGWREGPPGTWRFRPTGLVPLGLLSGGTWLSLAVLAWRGRRPRPDARSPVATVAERSQGTLQDHGP